GRGNRRLFPRRDRHSRGEDTPDGRASVRVRRAARRCHISIHAHRLAVVAYVLHPHIDRRRRPAVVGQRYLERGGVVDTGWRRSRRRPGRCSRCWRGCRCGARSVLPQDDETIVVIRDCDIKSTIVGDVTNRNTVGTIAAGIWNLVNLFAREPAVVVLEIDTSPLISVVNYNYVLPPVPVDISRLHGTWE